MELGPVVDEEEDSQRFFNGFPQSSGFPANDSSSWLTRMSDSGIAPLRLLNDKSDLVQYHLLVGLGLGEHEFGLGELELRLALGELELGLLQLASGIIKKLD